MIPNQSEPAPGGLVTLEEAGALLARAPGSGGAEARGLRLGVTWEALEPGSPGVYDEAWIAGLRKLLLLAAERGVPVYLDSRMDRWSRWTGGAGAPGWTLAEAGLDPARIAAGAGAAAAGGGPAPGSDAPAGGGAAETTAAAMFARFFAGADPGGPGSAPGSPADPVPPLQERYLAAFRHCFRRLKNCRALAGWGVMGGLRPDFAAALPGEPAAAAFLREYFHPFVRRFVARMSEADRPVLYFVERPLAGGGIYIEENEGTPGAASRALSRDALRIWEA